MEHPLTLNHPFSYVKFSLRNLGFQLSKELRVDSLPPINMSGDELSQTTKTKRQRQFLTLWNQYKESITSVKYLKGYHELEQATISILLLSRMGLGQQECPRRTLMDKT
jgi:hypothetical protein